MRVPPMFAADDAAIAGLIAAQPLGLLVSQGPSGLQATPLPLLLQHDAAGGWWLLGHMARGNPHVAALREVPEALVLFLGPHGYISPSWFEDRQQAPTWNFALAQLQVRVMFDDRPEASDEALTALTEAMETGRSRAWQVHELGDRYARLRPAVVAFRAEVTRHWGKFKLGQNERLDVLQQALIGLHDQPALAQAMRRANAQRLSKSDSRHLMGIDQ